MSIMCDGLIPIGVFWDIENISIPKKKSAFRIVQTIRHTFFDGHKEAEFVCVCDTVKERKDVIQELNAAQVGKQKEDYLWYLVLNYE